MEKLKELLGDELFNAIQSKLEGYHIIVSGKDEKYIPDDGTMVAKERLDELMEQNNNHKGQVDTLNAEITGLKEKLKDHDILSARIDELKNGLKAKEEETVNITKKFALRNALRESGAKYIELLESKFDISKASLSSGGTIENFEELLQPVKQLYKELFGERKIEGNPPFNSSGSGSGEDVFSMEQLRQMPHNEIKKNLEKVNKSIEYWSKEK